MERMVLEVLGIPDIDPQDRMVDRLKIHFLSRSNSGGDVLEVLYPTSAPGKAYVIFEAEEVPGVLQCTHVLEVDSRFYPIHVQRAHQSKVDMAVETTLDIREFPNPLEVLQLLKAHGFEVAEQPTGCLHLEGSFLSLKLLRKQLIQLLAQNTPPQSRLPSAPSNGFSSSSACKIEPDRLKSRSVTPSSSKQGHVKVNGVRPHSRRSFTDDEPSCSGVSSTSPVYGDSASGGSPRSLPNLYDESYRRPSSSNRGEARVLVDRDVLDYILVYQQDFVKKIEMLCRTEMRLKDDGEFTTVTLLGENCKRAEAELQALIQKISPRLRIQEIPLNEYSREQQAQICERIQLYKDLDLGVLIKLSDDIVKLVGSSRRSFLIKQNLLGNSDDPSTSNQRGRELERNTRLRRSSSLPRQYKVNKDKETDEGRHPEPQYNASLAKDYSPSHYQVESKPRRAPQVAQGHPRSSQEPPLRARSSSEVRNQRRETREQPTDRMSPSSGSEVKSTKKLIPDVKKPFGIDLRNAGPALKNVLRQKKKSLSSTRDDD